MMRNRLLLALIACAVSSGQAIASDSSPPDPIAQKVQRAEKFVSSTLLSKIRNMNVAFHWIGDTDSFWFRKTLEDGSAQFVRVDAATGAQAPLFDHGRMFAALAAAGAQPAPKILQARVSRDGTTIMLDVAKSGASCEWPTAPGRCTLPSDSYVCEIATPACQALKPTGAGISSPDGRRLAFIRDHNLWIRDVATGAERRLSADGMAHFAYGQTHSQLDSNQAVRRRAGQPEPVTGIRWSPDGRFIVAFRHDMRDIPERVILEEFVPPDAEGPIVHRRRVARASDAKHPDARLDIFDTVSGRARQSDFDPQGFADIAPIFFGFGSLWWSPDNQTLWMLSSRRGARDLRLVRVDMVSGATRDVIRETADMTIMSSRNPLTGPAVEILARRGEAIWYSDRSGWGHLYLHDLASGRIKRQLTKGDWNVIDLVHVNQETGMAYVAAVGREAGRHPNYRHLYRVPLDGGTPVLLTPEDADHSFGDDFLFGGGDGHGGSISPSGRYIIDSYSTPCMPDKSVLRTIDGTTIAPVVDADVTQLLAMGWRPPEQFSVKAADGKTDLYGILAKPVDFDPSRNYPVIEIVYPAPGFKMTPISFWENFTSTVTLNSRAFAELGTVVVALDARGTGWRSRAFRKHFHGTDDAIGLEDHVAAIRNLAGRHAFIDASRVGITGHSWGGYGSLRGMLAYPDFFKVAVSGEGSGSFLTSSLDIVAERVFGEPSTPAMKAYYKRLSNESLAAQLKGKLLLIYAGVDGAVPLLSGFQIAAALNDADRNYDMLIMPDSPHFGGREPYGVRRTLRYFAEHLTGP